MNSSPLGTILNLLSTISFSDSVDELDDELDEEEYEEGDILLISRFDLDFFRLFLLERFTFSGLDEGEFLFLFLDLCRLSSFFVEKVSRFSDFKRCSIVVAERRCFFLTSSILLIENLQNRFFQLYNCNNHTAINVKKIIYLKK